MINIEPVKIRATIKSLLKRDDSLAFEAKLDGSRYLLYKIGNEIKLLGRNKSKVTGEFLNKIDNVPHIKEWAKQLKGDFVLDGEILHSEGFGTCAGLMNSKSEKSIKTQKTKGLLNYYVFDIPVFNGDDIRTLPYTDRRALLRTLIDENKESFIYITLIIGTSETTDIESAFKLARTKGFEGLVIKTFKGEYKNSDWAKKKDEKTYDYVITGFINSESKTYKGKGIAALELGLYDGSSLEKVLKCSGMSNSWREEFYNNKKSYMLKVVEIKGQEMFPTGAVRHPNFLRIRDDMFPEDQTFQKYELRLNQNNKIDL